MNYKNQKDIFLNGEGDRWFLRNRDKILSAPENTDHLLPILEHLEPGMKVLEVGCSFGANLNSLNSKISSIEFFGIDPSSEAINEGKKIYPFLNLCQGTAEDIEKINTKFDVIFFGFCLYLVDRESLNGIVAKVDESLKPGGYVGIIDFDARVPFENSYVHREGVLSYKMDYSQIFLNNSNYFLVSKKSWSHAGFQFHEDKNERCSTQVLYKEKG